MTFTGSAQSPDASKPQQERSRVDSWKSIAAYLDRDVRTVERWAKERGLPVRRTPGTKGHRVFAFPDELDAWLTGQCFVQTDELARAERRTVFSVRVLAPVAILVAVAALAVMLATRHDVGPVQSLSVQGRDLVAVDAQRRPAWRFRYETSRIRTTSWLLHPGLAAVEVLAAIEAELHHDEAQLDAFSSAGRRLWSYRHTGDAAFGAGRYDPPWMNSDLTVFGPASNRRVAWVVHHNTWWPGLALVIDAQGRLVDEFVNAGWITWIRASVDGRYLFAAGINQEFNASMLAVLDAGHPSGSSPVDRGEGFACTTCPQGRPVKYFVMARPELHAFGGQPVEVARVAAYDDGGFALRVPAAAETLLSAEVIYEFTKDLRLTYATASDQYWDWHRRLEARGSLAHPASACAERAGFSVREWTPETGWKELRVPARRSDADPR